MQFPLAVSYFGLWTAFLSNLFPLSCLLPCSYPTKSHILSLYWHCHYGSFSLIWRCHISVLSTCLQILPCSDCLSQTRKPEQKWPHSGLRHALGGQSGQGHLVKHGKDRAGSQNFVAVKLAEEVLVPEKIAGALWKWWWRGGGEESPYYLRHSGGVHASCTGLAEWCVMVPEVRITYKSDYSFIWDGRRSFIRGGFGISRAKVALEKMLPQVAITVEQWAFHTLLPM